VGAKDANDLIDTAWYDAQQCVESPLPFSMWAMSIRQNGKEIVTELRDFWSMLDGIQYNASQMQPALWIGKNCPESVYHVRPRETTQRLHGPIISPEPRVNLCQPLEGFKEDLSVTRGHWGSITIDHNAIRVSGNKYRSIFWQKRCEPCMEAAQFRGWYSFDPD
jgi:hypothetical protein